MSVSGSDESDESPPELISVPDAVDGRLRIAENTGDDEDTDAWITGRPVEVEP